MININRFNFDIIDKIDSVIDSLKLNNIEIVILLLSLRNIKEIIR